MSLINDMLRDLEARSPAGGAKAGVLSGLSVSGPQGRRPVVAALAVMTLVLLVAVAVLLWQRTGGQRPDQAAASAPSTPVAPVPDQAPRPALAKPPAVPPAPRAAARVAMPDPVGEERPPSPPPGDGEPGQPTSGKATAQLAEESTPPQTQKHAESQSAAPAPPAKPAREARAPTPKARSPKPKASPSIKKHVRPLTPRQRAIVAYRSGIGFLQDGRAGEAEAKLREAVQHDPGYRQARETLAGLLMQQGKTQAAAQCLEEGLRERPGEPAFAALLARIRVQQGELAAAVGILERSLSAGGASPENYAFLAALQQRQGHYRKSVESYRQALERTPGRGVWWMGMAISLERAGEPAAAAEAYGRALEAGGLNEQLRQYCRGRRQALTEG